MTKQKGGVRHFQKKMARQEEVERRDRDHQMKISNRDVVTVGEKMWEKSQEQEKRGSAECKDTKVLVGSSSRRVSRFGWMR